METLRSRTALQVVQDDACRFRGTCWCYASSAVLLLSELALLRAQHKTRTHESPHAHNTRRTHKNLRTKFELCGAHAAWKEGHSLHEVAELVVF